MAFGRFIVERIVHEGSFWTGFEHKISVASTYWKVAPTTWLLTQIVIG